MWGARNLFSEKKREEVKTRQGTVYIRYCVINASTKRVKNLSDKTSDVPASLFPFTSRKKLVCPSARPPLRLAMH